MSTLGETAKQKSTAFVQGSREIVHRSALLIFINVTRAAPLLWAPVLPILVASAAPATAINLFKKFVNF